jgi:hypothetical protein
MSQISSISDVFAYMNKSIDRAMDESEGHGAFDPCQNCNKEDCDDCDNCNQLIINTKQNEN